MVCVAVLQRRLIGRPSADPPPWDACGSVLQRIGADLSRATELRPRLSVQNPFQKGGTTASPTYWLWPGRRCRNWPSPAKPKQARNIKDLKGLKCRYTFGIGATNRNRGSARGGGGKRE